VAEEVHLEDAPPPLQRRDFDWARAGDAGIIDQRPQRTLLRVAVDACHQPQRSQDEFLAIVADLVGERDARRYGALLIGSMNGITGMAVSNQLADPKWGVKAEELIDTLVDMISNVSQRANKG
jgi:hypothetical protein